MFKMRIAPTRAEPIQIALMRPLHGERIYDEFAQRRGSGLHDLGIITDNMEQSLNEMEDRSVFRRGGYLGARTRKCLNERLF